jgi:hypothetical protein
VQTGLNEVVVSNEIVYLNNLTTEVKNTINPIKNIVLSCKDAEQGYYYKYSVDNSISSTEASQNRILSLTFDIISSEGLKMNDPFIKWYIPTNNTMIVPP